LDKQATNSQDDEICLIGSADESASLPRSPGVYQITCLANGKIYIGSAVNLRRRLEEHWHGLRGGYHHNRHLQSAWNKYGKSQFRFSVLELTGVDDVLRAEQIWIDKTGCADRRIGFNIFDVAGSPGQAFARVWEGFVDPNGSEVTITNLHDFCRTHDLDHPSMMRLAQGKSKLKSYKGWTHRNSIRKRAYIKTYEGFVDPEGHAVGSITNLAAFCRERGLDNTHMVAVAHGRLISHCGWTYDSGRQRVIKVHFGFISPAGERVEIVNLLAFWRENGLSPIHMHNVKSGVRRSHKGWTWREPDDSSA
jgi:group I intron endonuclease